MAHQGIETWNAGISVIFSEELAIDEHFQVFVFRLRLMVTPAKRETVKSRMRAKVRLSVRMALGTEVKQGDLSGGRRNADCFGARFGPRWVREER